MENKIERMTDMISDGVNNLNPSAYCDTSSAEKVRFSKVYFSVFYHFNSNPGSDCTSNSET